MWRKSIFTALALALAWGLGNALHEIWLSGQIHTAAARLAPAADYSYSANRGPFLFHFGVVALVAACGVLLTLSLGWMKVDK
jgi:hypothetical protein